MSALLARLLGRMPVGWLQLTGNRSRLSAAIAGVAFANVLVFVQLGIMGSLNNTIRAGYAYLDASIMISAEDANTLDEGGNVPRQWLFQSLADPEVIDGAPLYLGTITWSRAVDDTSFLTFALPPDKIDFFVPAIAQRGELLRLPDALLVDYLARGTEPEVMAGIRPQSPLRVEVAGQQVHFVATFAGGGSFAADGYAATSDQTFLRLFPERQAGAPDHILLRLAAGADADAVIARLRETLPDNLRVRTVEDAADQDVTFQTTERPTGLIFGFGAVMGAIVGVVIVYQILSTDVADHLAEYATFKAMGYAPGFFLGVVFEEAMVLAVLGFIPGIVISWLCYVLIATMTGLPLTLTVATAVIVFVGTLVACAISGAVATRRLTAADPADLF